MQRLIDTSTIFKSAFIVVMSILLLSAPLFAQQVGSGLRLGTGARATALAGNHVAIANDLSAVHWNPAALAFLPVREFQMTLDAMNFGVDADVEGVGIYVPNSAGMSGERDRVRLSSLGAMTAIPTIQGGLTIAASFDRTYAFDDYMVFNFHHEDFGEAYKFDNRNYGDLNSWSGAFGVQIAPNLALGLTLSFITGTEFNPIFQDFVDIDTGEKIEDGDYYFDGEYRTRYQGYSITLGLMARLSEEFSLAARINPINSLRYKEDWKNANSSRYTNSVDGRAYIAPSGALGAGLTLPFLTAALDFRFTMPQTLVLDARDADDMPRDMQASKFKFGAGLGVEVPVPNAPVVFRGGYSFDQYDLYNIIHTPDNERIDWEGDIDWVEVRRYLPSRHHHTISFGFATFTSGIGFEMSYAYKTWGIATDNFWHDFLGDGVRFSQDYSTHRVMMGIIYRY